MARNSTNTNLSSFVHLRALINGNNLKKIKCSNKWMSLEVNKKSRFSLYNIYISYNNNVIVEKNEI